MRRIFRVVAPALLALSLMAPAVLALSPGTLEAIEEVKRETVEIRGLAELEPIDVRFMTVEELERKLIEDLNKDMTEEDWARDQALLKLLGFLEQDDDYYDIMLRLYTEQIAGFYDPEEKYLAIISDKKEMSAMDKLFLSHELTHALQDQHYHLDQPPFDNPDSTNLDADFAATCLIEGDATLTMTRFQETFSYEDLLGMMGEYGDVETDEFDAAPRYIRDSLLFPYTEGEAFVRKLYKRGRFASVDAAYANPPASTEQVMHPEKYFSGEAPDQVECPDIASALGEGWKLADTNVMGEFDVAELLMTELSDHDSERGADGWGGCQYRFYTDAKSSESLLVIDLTWDDEAEAEEFAGLFGQYALKRYGLERGSLDMEEGWARWDAGEDGGLALGLEGVETLVLLSDGRDGLTAALGALGGRGPGLQEVLERHPEAAVSPEGSKGVNWTALGIIAFAAALMLLIALAVLTVSRREGRARELGGPGSPPDPPPSIGDA